MTIIRTATLTILFTLIAALPSQPTSATLLKIVCSSIQGLYYCYVLAERVLLTKEVDY